MVSVRFTRMRVQNGSGYLILKHKRHPRCFARIFSEPHPLANRFAHSKLIFVFLYIEITFRNCSNPKL
jgi:hypothetical protein